MDVLRRISEQRVKHILSQADSYLDEGEEVREWMRIKQPQGRRSGFAFVTDQRCIVHWTGRGDGHVSRRWDDIDSWGVDTEARGGPLLFIGIGDDETYVQIPTETQGLARKAKDFLNEFAVRAPASEEVAVDARRPGQFGQQVDRDLPVGRKTVKDQTRRVLVTILGVAIVVGSILIIPLPGPWSILGIIAGLALLASEYDWAKDLQHWARDRYKRTANKLKNRTS